MNMVRRMVTSEIRALIREFNGKRRFGANLTSLLILLLTSSAHADRAAEIDSYLQDFSRDPKITMELLPKKWNSRGTGPRTSFSSASIASRDFVLEKDKVRRKFCTERGGARICLDSVLPGRAAMLDNDRAENLVDNGATLLRSAEQMESAGLLVAQLPESPWSSSYWPTAQGTLGARYADPSFPKSSSWNKNKKYVGRPENDFISIFNAADASSIDNLSPSEKYDLLVGDSAGTLTHAMWDEGAQVQSKYGKVADWLGICDGWAPASFSVPRPRQSIQMLAADGRTQLTFYPSDIKGLASLLWAKQLGQVRMVGVRCGEKKPPKDSNGRVISSECFDTNPGTWHLAVVNQIGVSRRGMVIDATYDFEVWNQPVAGYSYTYFNPQTHKNVSAIRNAMVRIEDFTSDKFSSYRSKDARSVVGVAMDLTYVEETDPSHDPSDSADRDKLQTVRYMYDLELNENGEIIGGEWYHNAHPDFLWTGPPTAWPLTAGDQLIQENWDGQGTIPQSWRTAAVAVSRTGSPLARVVEILGLLSNLK
jgi:hypothetical protein